MADLFNDRGNGGNMTPQTQPQAQPQDTQNQGFNAAPAVASAFRQKMARFGQPQNAPGGAPTTTPTNPFTQPQTYGNNGNGLGNGTRQPEFDPSFYANGGGLNQPESPQMGNGGIGLGSGIKPGPGTPPPGWTPPAPTTSSWQMPRPGPSPFEDGVPAPEVGGWGNPMGRQPGLGPKPMPPPYYGEGGIPNPMPQPPNPWGAKGGPYGPPQPQSPGPLSDPSIQGNPILGGPGGPADGGFVPIDPNPHAVKGSPMPLPPVANRLWPSTWGAMQQEPMVGEARVPNDPTRARGGNVADPLSGLDRAGWQW